MKKVVSMILTLALLLALLTACASKKSSEPGSSRGGTQKTAEQAEESIGKSVVTVLMDLPIQVDYSPEEFTKTMSGLPGYETDFWVQFESIPAMGTERDTALTRIRTEILAGKGPDLFLCAQRLYGVTAGPEDMPFFHFPVQAMNNHMLLPLDNYIENAEYMEWDQLQPVVMAAGRNEEGQQIMPLTYTFTATFFDKEKYAPERDCPMTWEEMTEDPDAEIRLASNVAILGDVIGEVADYSKDVPTFTEEELRTWAAKNFETSQTVPEDMWEEVKYRVSMDRMSLENCEIDLSGGQEYTIIPVYNLDGGVTANITAFAAINRNARHPDEAFKIIDYLLKPQVQLTSPLFQNRMEGMPVYVNTGDENTIAGSWRMTEDNFRQISAIREQINTAKFLGPLEACLWGVQAYNEEVLKKTSHEQYVLMEMLLGES